MRSFVNVDPRRNSSECVPSQTFQQVLDLVPNYYEAFSIDRPCDHLSASDIPSKYTIVHWAFANLSDAFEPSVSPYENGWTDFKAQTGFKRIVSFGGWTFSTAVSTSKIYKRFYAD
jgi:hypothetical protein